MSVNPIPPGAKPPINLGGMIRQSGRSLYKGLLGRSFSSVGAEKVLELKLGPIALATVAGAALLYNQGAESTKGDGANMGFWKRVLLESGLGYFIVDNTKGLYTLWGIGLSAFRAGQKPNLLEKVQAVASTVTTMALGYLGIHLGASFTEAAHELEEREMFKALSNPDMERWIQRLEGEADAGPKALGETLRRFKTKLAEQDELFRSGIQQDWKAMRPMRREIAGLKADVFGKLTSLDEAIVRPKGLPVQKAFKVFAEALGSSQEAYIKAVRALNPLFGYIILGLLVGTPVAKLINKQIEKLYPQWRNMSFKELFGVSNLPEPRGPGAHGLSERPTLYMPGIGNGMLQ